MKLSIVSTLYCSASHIKEFYERSSAAARKLAGDDYEIVLVNDGSPDNSLELAVALTEADPHVMVVDLSRNFGHHKAMMRGLIEACGEHIFLIDCDLEEEPEWLLDFAKQMKEEGSDVVYGVQKNRKGAFFERWSGRAFYFIFKMASGLDLMSNSVTARLMTRRYVDALLLHKEREFFLGGLLCLTGFSQSHHYISKHSRSETTYTFRKKMSLFITSITSFSIAPLLLIFYSGLLVFLLSFSYVCYLLLQYTINQSIVSGWTSLITSIWLLGGMIILSIGIVGIYLSKVFLEVKERPVTIVRKIYGRR